VDRTRLTRWLIPLPAIFLSFFSTTAQAEPIAGLNAVGYSVSAIPPTRSDDIYPVCHSEIENNINRNFNGEPFGNCPNDNFMVHYTGFITVPANNTIKFMVAADDGGTVKIGLTEFGTWNTKGCSWSAQTTEPFEAGIYPLDGWFFEANGYTCYMLAWNINNTGWAIVPDLAFTTSVVSTTTTTSTSTTTSSTTTTTIQETTTTFSSTTSTTTIQETTTTWAPSTTSTTSTTTSTITVPPTTVPATTTTTSLPVPTATTSTTVIEVSTSTTQPEVTERESKVSQDTTSPTTEPLPEPTTTVLDIKKPEETISTIYLPDLPADTSLPDETTIPEVTVSLPEVSSPEVEPVLDETDVQEEEEEPGEYTPDTTEVEEPYSSSTTLPDIPVDEPVTDKQIEEILSVFVEAEPEQIVAAITQLLAAEITSDQASKIASSPEVLAAITEDQAEELFKQIDVEELTKEQLEEFTAAIQEAPTKVKKAFEKTIDIFGSQFEDYVPTGSSIPVKTRRTLIAAGALIAAIPSTRIRR